MVFFLFNFYLKFRFEVLILLKFWEVHNFYVHNSVMVVVFFSNSLFQKKTKMSSNDKIPSLTTTDIWHFPFPQLKLWLQMKVCILERSSFSLFIYN